MREGATVVGRGATAPGEQTTIDSLPDRPIRSEEARAFTNVEAIEAAVVLSHAHPEMSDLVLLLVDGRVHCLSYGPEDGWSAVGVAACRPCRRRPILPMAGSLPTTNRTTGR